MGSHPLLSLALKLALHAAQQQRRPPFLFFFHSPVRRCTGPVWSCKVVHQYLLGPLSCEALVAAGVPSMGSRRISRVELFKYSVPGARVEQRQNIAQAKS